MNQTQALIQRFQEVINSDRQALINSVLDQRTRHITVVLEDFYHTYNASAILRTSECLGIQDIHIIEDKNIYQVNKDVLKGSYKWLTLHRYNQETNLGRIDCINHLKKNGYKLAAMSLQEDTVSLDQIDYSDKIAFCFGTEETGLSDLMHEHADYFVKLPMTGFTQSFNVSVSAGISLSSAINTLESQDISWQLTENERDELLLDWLIKSTPTGKQLYEHYLSDLK